MHNEDRLRKRRNKNYICDDTPLVEKESVPLVEEEPSLPKNVPDDMRKILCIDTGEVFHVGKGKGKRGK